MEKLKKKFGQHYLIEFIECNADSLKFVAGIKNHLLEAAAVSEATIVKSHFYQYQPYGVSGIILIQESHFSIHTWPESNYAAFDILTCGQMYPQRGIDYLKEAFEAKKTEVKMFARGFE